MKELGMIRLVSMILILLQTPLGLGQRVPTECECRNVALQWCEGESCRPGDRPKTRNVFQCSSLVFVNKARRDYTITLQTTVGRRDISRVQVAGTGAQQQEVARFDETGRYLLFVAGESKTHLVRVTVTSRNNNCAGVIGYCVDPVDSTRHNPGSTWQRDTCTSCSCTSRNGGLRPICNVDRCGAKTCRGGYQPSVQAGQCCAECPCVCYNSPQRRYERVGSVWNEPCHTCRCTGATYGSACQKVCTKDRCPAPAVPLCRAGQHPFDVRASNPACCPPYKSCRLPDPRPTPAVCVEDGRTYRHGVTWSSDSCTTCRCENGVPICSSRRCTTVAPPTPIGCRDSSNRARRPDERWRQGCEVCLCPVGGGKVKCYPGVCPPPRLCPGGQLPLRTGTRGCCDTYSCPKCCRDRGKSYAEGDTWNRDSCTPCRCTGCSVVCERTEVCPDLNCAQQLAPHEAEAVRQPGQCCPNACARLCPWQCGEQVYAVTFTPTFSRQTLRDFPLNGRLSDLFLLPHRYNYFLWSQGEKASAGLVNFIRTTDTGTLREELDHIADSVLTSTSFSASEPSSKLVATDHRHAVISLAGGILPSPDWFYGVAAIDLCDAGRGRWKRNVTADLLPYDLGVNMGRNFFATRDDRRTPLSISPISSLQQERRHFYPPKPLPERVHPVGRITFQLLSDGCPGF